MSKLTQLFVEFVDAHNSGQHPSLEAYLLRAGAKSGALERMINGFLEAALESAADRVVTRVSSTLAEQEYNPPTSDASFAELISEHEDSLRVRAKCTRDSIAERIAKRGAVPPAHLGKFKALYHKLKTNQLDPRRVTSRLIQALSDVLNVSISDLLHAAAGYRPREVVQLMQFTRMDKQRSAWKTVYASDEEAVAPDMVDRMFFGDVPDARSCD